MGNISLNASCNWQMKEVHKLKNGKLQKSIEIVDMITLNRYKKDCVQSTAQKAILVFLFNPIIMVLKIAFNFVQIAFDYAKVTIDSTLDTIAATKSKNVIKLIEICISSRICFFKYLIENIISIVKAPFYAIGIQLASIYMFFDPLNGLKLIACMERGWNNNKSSKYDYRFSKEAQNKPLYSFLWQVLLKRNEDIVFYMAPCFQWRGSLKDKHIVYYSDIPKQS